MKEEIALSQGFGMRKLQRKAAKSQQDQQHLLNEKLSGAGASEDLSTSVSDSLMTQFIRDRYRNMLDNELNTVLFIIVKSDSGVEISGHIDLNQRVTDDPNFQKYLKGTRHIMPHSSDLSFHHWNSGKTLLGNSSNWEIVTDFGVAKLKNKHSGDLVTMDALQKVIDPDINKVKSRKKGKERKSSRKWTEIENDRDSGLRIMFWDLFLNK